MAGLDLFERMIVVNVLRRVMKIYQYLGITVWKKAIHLVAMLNPFEVNEYLNELVERSHGHVDLIDHL